MCTVCIALIFLFVNSQYCLPDTVNGQIAVSDSIQVYPKKMNAEKHWEKAVNFPGRVLFVPFHLTFKGAETFAEHILTPKVVQRIADELAQYKPKYMSFKYSSRHGAGVAYNQRNVFNTGSKFDAGGQWGLRSRYRYRLRLTGVKLFGDSVTSDVRLWHRFLSDESFYGTGNETKESDESTYGLRQSTAEASLNTHLSQALTVSARVGMDVNTVENGKDSDLDNTKDNYTETQLPGSGKRAKIARIQIGLKRISLNKAVKPTAGDILEAGCGLFKDFDTVDFNFWKFSASYKHYIELFQDRTIAVRIAGERTDSFTGKMVPFYYLSEIGSQETVRGFTRDRYRDRDMVMASLEYTYPIYRRKLDALIFVDGGQVSPDIVKDFSLKDFHAGYGAGLNVWGREKLTLQTVVGVSEERVRYYLSLNKQY